MKKLVYFLLIFLVSCGNADNIADSSNESVEEGFLIYDILSPDDKYNSRTFSSVVKTNNEYIIFYSVRDVETWEYSIYRNSSSDYMNFDNSNEIEVVPNKSDTYSFMHTYVPYVFYENDTYYMIFTAREYENDTFEAVYIATSSNSYDWEVNLNPILIPEFQWEGNEIENWGLIKIEDKYYMNFESAGPNRLQEERHVGNAYSEDLINWYKISENPTIKNTVYCASFFSYNNEIYIVVPNVHQFKVYKFTDFEKLSEKNFIGFFRPYGTSEEFEVDTPEIITNDIKKEVSNSDEFNFIFGSYRAGEWYTSIINFKNVEEFLSSLKKN
mgnify:CR=1 FL=1|tara:strand:- start:1675 stop:2655 length:981 start_codon:yes stop_codon:yes gene_type:complete